MNSVREVMIDHLMLLRKDLIIDNCHVSSKFITIYQAKAKELYYELIIQDFSDVEYDLCLKRNSERERKVPENVISNMFSEMMKTKLKLNF